MIRSIGLCVVCSCLAGVGAASAEEPAHAAVVNGGVSLSEIITAVAKKTGKKFVVDPAAPAQVALIGQSPASVSYSDLVTILSVNGFAAVEDGGYVQVIPNAGVRYHASRLVTGKESIPDDEFVTSLVHLKNVPAAIEVPILRPLLPQNAHLAADVCSNNLLIVDTFGNYKRIAAIVQSLDVGEPYKSNCTAAREPK